MPNTYSINSNSSQKIVNELRTLDKSINAVCLPTLSTMSVDECVMILNSIPNHIMHLDLSRDYPHDLLDDLDAYSTEYMRVLASRPLGLGSMKENELQVIANAIPRSIKTLNLSDNNFFGGRKIAAFFAALKGHIERLNLANNNLCLEEDDDYHHPVSWRNDGLIKTLNAISDDVKYLCLGRELSPHVADNDFLKGIKGLMPNIKELVLYPESDKTKQNNLIQAVFPHARIYYVESEQITREKITKTIPKLISLAHNKHSLFNQFPRDVQAKIAVYAADISLAGVNQIDAEKQAHEQLIDCQILIKQLKEDQTSVVSITLEKTNLIQNK
jgi:hypothetical protein